MTSREIVKCCRSFPAVSKLLKLPASRCVFNVPPYTASAIYFGCRQRCSYSFVVPLSDSPRLTLTCFAFRQFQSFLRRRYFRRPPPLAPSPVISTRTSAGCSRPAVGVRKLAVSLTFSLRNHLPPVAKIRPFDQLDTSRILSTHPRSDFL